jgi:hypothetical protein
MMRLALVISIRTSPVASTWLSQFATPARQRRAGYIDACENLDALAVEEARGLEPLTASGFLRPPS